MFIHQEEIIDLKTRILTAAVTDLSVYSKLNFKLFDTEDEININKHELKKHFDQSFTMKK